MLKSILLFSFSIIYNFISPPPAVSFKEVIPSLKVADESEQIIIFTQNSDKVFLENTLPKVRQLCKTKNIKLIEKKIEEGLPSEITTTPCLVFQNAKGRSVFSGRYTEWTSVMNFIRTSRFLPSEKGEKDCRDTVFSCQNGRTTLFSVLKITHLTGELPPNFSQNAFQASAKNAISAAFSQFKNGGEVCKQKTDRAFYLDFYPYRDKKGIYYMSVALFSQFNCITPIFENAEKPLQNTDFQLLMKQATVLLEKEIFQQLKNSPNGDAISFISAEIPTKSWENLNLSLPKEKENVLKNTAENRKIPQNWQYVGAVNEDIPALQFHFLAPLDRYVGEIKKMNGTLFLSDNQQIKEGYFETEMLSLTMGAEDFDHKIQSKYIKANKYPKARFHFEKIAFPSALKMWESQTFPIEGDLFFMEKNQKLKVMATFTPVLVENGDIIMEVSTNFNLNIDYYGIKGPDGPKSAAENMAFLMNFRLKAI
jgi:hypothetical protein